MTTPQMRVPVDCDWNFYVLAEVFAQFEGAIGGKVYQPNDCGQRNRRINAKEMQKRTADPKRRLKRKSPR